MHSRGLRAEARVALGAAGGLLLGLSAGRRPLAGLVLGMAGGALVHRALAGPGAASWGRSPSRVLSDGIRVEESIQIAAEPHELFELWRDVGNLPLFLAHVERVQPLDEGRSAWTVRGPLGRPVTWESEVFHEVQDEVIAWRSMPGSPIRQAGSVRFRPVAGGQFTEVTVNLQYKPRLGKAAGRLARLLGADPARQIRQDLQRMKDLLEAEEMATLDHG